MIADVGVFDLDYRNMPARAGEIESAFQRAACFIKSGEIVVKDGEVIGHGHKKTVWVNVNMPTNQQVTRDIAQSFTKDYTVQLQNYPVKDYLAPHPFVINVDVEA
jgi:formylmethanofuran dehydrogenase subunit A